MKKIIFATTNEGKLREAREILEVEVLPLKLEVDEVQTTDPIECLIKKTEAAYKIAKKPILVEDLCLFFDAWNGLPGVFIDYFMKTLDNKGIIKLMKNEKNRKAIAQTNLCFFDGKKKVITTGEIKGTIAPGIRGTNGFGWDSIFIPEGYSKTFAQMTNEQKNQISMRKIALEKMKKKLGLTSKK